MREHTKQRLIGSLVLLALAVIFVPMLLSGPVQRTRVDVPIDVPPQPSVDMDQRLPPRDFADAPLSDLHDSDGASAQASSEAGESTSGRDAPAAVESPRTAKAGDGEADSREADGPVAEERAGPHPAPADTIAPAPTAADQSAGNWAVQTGAFGRQENAIRLRDRLRQAGFTVYVDRAGSESDPLYRVRVGPVTERTEAESLAGRLSREQDLKGLVVPH